MKNFTFSHYSFLIKAETPLSLPSYKGSTLRGGFGHAFRRTCCVQRNIDCKDCLLVGQCVYSWVFETPVPKDTRMMRKYTKAPHPFVLDPPLETKNSYELGEKLTFGLTLMGRAVDFLPYFIYSFHELGKMGIGKGRGKFFLEEVLEKHIRNGAESTRSVYSGETKTLSETTGPLSWEDLLDGPAPSGVSLSFLTPLRIKYNGQLTKDLSFHILFRNLLRRISLLSYFHCGHKIDDSIFKDMIEKAREIKTAEKITYWQDWKRWSQRQAISMNMGGVMGEITYEGDMEPFWPYLRLGEYVHVGKGSSFGLGRYEMVRGENDG